MCSVETCLQEQLADTCGAGGGVNTCRQAGAGVGASQLTSCDQPSLHLAIRHQAQSASNLPLAVSDINLDAMGSDSKHPK